MIGESFNEFDIGTNPGFGIYNEAENRPFERQSSQMYPS
jgi:hypothetical protein